MVDFIFTSNAGISLLSGRRCCFRAADIIGPIGSVLSATFADRSGSNTYTKMTTPSPSIRDTLENSRVMRIGLLPHDDLAWLWMGADIVYGTDIQGKIIVMKNRYGDSDHPSQEIIDHLTQLEVNRALCA